MAKKKKGLLGGLIKFAKDLDKSIVSILSLGR